MKSIINDFIKSSEKNFPTDRQHVNNMKLMVGSEDVQKYCPAAGRKGAGDYGFFTAIYESYNNHWALKTTPDDWWYTIIRTVAIAIDKKSKEDSVRQFFAKVQDLVRWVGWSWLLA